MGERCKAGCHRALSPLETVTRSHTTAKSTQPQRQHTIHTHVSMRRSSCAVSFFSEGPQHMTNASPQGLVAQVHTVHITSDAYQNACQHAQTQFESDNLIVKFHLTLKVIWLQALVYLALPSLQPRDLNILSAYDHVTDYNQLSRQHITKHARHANSTALQSRGLSQTHQKKKQINSGTLKLHKKV